MSTAAEVGAYIGKKVTVAYSVARGDKGCIGDLPLVPGKEWRDAAATVEGPVRIEVDVATVTSMDNNRIVMKRLAANRPSGDPLLSVPSNFTGFIDDRDRKALKRRGIDIRENTDAHHDVTAVEVWVAGQKQD